MKRLQKTVAGLMVFAMLLSLSSCTSGRRKGADRVISQEPSKQEHGGTATDYPTDGPGSTDAPVNTDTPSSGYYSDSEILNFTMFAGMTGKEIDRDNEIRELIAKKAGARVYETWLTGDFESNAVNSIIASGKFPDFIYTGEMQTLYEGGYLIVWDDYIEKYPNIKALYSDAEWDKFRQADGHIYWADCFGRFNQKDTTTLSTGQSFWIQARVLEAYGYPKVETLDQYFAILEKYAEEHPELPNGTKVIPYTCLCEDWKYFCLEAPPMYLDGYPNNGSIIVNVDAGMNKPKVIDYNMTDTAKAYFKKLNEEYQKGIVDPAFAEQTYDQYIAKLSTGAVLGLCDQYWNFGYSIMGPFSVEQKGPNGSIIPSDIGCDYIPLGLVMKAGTKQQWYSLDSGLNTYAGIAVTTSCSDPDRAFKFLDYILSQEGHDLRFWGVEGVDYLVDDNGLFYRTEAMRSNWRSDSYRASHVCEYSYMPQWRGVRSDGKNCMMPKDQGSEYKATLPEAVARCFTAYGVNNYVEMIGSDTSDRGPWFPMWSWSNGLFGDTPAGKAFSEMGKCKHKWLPEVVKAPDFEKTWKDYEKEYNDCNPQAFINEAQEEVNRRMR